MDKTVAIAAGTAADTADVAPTKTELSLALATTGRHS